MQVPRFVTGVVIGSIFYQESNLMLNLFGHDFRVDVNESIPAPVISGIPKGSVLAPIVFVIYINDTPDDVKSHDYLFADDTKIFR